MFLRLVSGSDKRGEWTLDQSPMVIGRDPSCSIIVEDARVSRRHAEIVRQHNRWIFRDCNSTNGALINNFRVKTHVLEHGDRIVLGSAEFLVIDNDSSEKPKGTTEERRSVINAIMPLDEAPSRLGGEARSPVGGGPARDDEKSKSRRRSGPADAAAELGQVRKRLKNLETLYSIMSEMSHCLAVEELRDTVAKAIFANFPDVERVCFLRREDNGVFSPEIVRTRGGDDTDDAFLISDAILQRAIESKSGILATDAVADRRFSASDSVVAHNVRSVMCAPLINRDEVLGAVYVDDRERAGCFDAEDLALLSAVAAQLAVALLNAQLYEDVQKAYQQAIVSLLNSLEARDPYTVGHTERVSRYALGIGIELGLSQGRLNLLHDAARLHDIGKIGVEDGLMTKAGALERHEVVSIQSHVLLAEKILKPIESLREAIPIIRGHHERYDGKGYPEGLEGEEILLESRILAVADALDAMTTQRHYNRPCSLIEAADRCRAAAGSQFDPQVVEALERYVQRNHAADKEAVNARSPGGSDDTPDNGISRQVRRQS